MSLENQPKTELQYCWQLVELASNIEDMKWMQEELARMKGKGGELEK